ncbi:hypothetical protein [Arthrobacter globiformis]|uniref:hypothetical protein n=1 Tax=Arthrobacter globiformis TaxID=1665 RepID=UPI00278CB6D9|nr:hypothetical protein [Arthrobacter globiformis]MDQ0620116.1 hypothetical protein [Arthrobacter globiformis]
MRSNPIWEGKHRFAISQSHVLVASTITAIVVVCVLIGFFPKFGIAILGLLAGTGLLILLGFDRSFVWLFLIPWQFLPFINASMIFNPWIWLAVLRLFSRKGEQPPVSKWMVSILVFLPAVAYVVTSLLWGAAESSLLVWVVPCVSIGISFLVRPPDSELMRRHLFLVGCVYAVLIIIEYVTDLSSNNLLADVPGVRDYLRSTRALGPAGNPLFSSAILLVAIFAIPKDLRYANVMRSIFIVALIMTGSKSALIGLVVGLLVAMYSLGIRRSVALITGSVVAFFLFVTALPSAAASLALRFSVFENLRDADPDRAFTTEFVLNSLRERPFGGVPLGSVLTAKRIHSPVQNGDRFGIESSWLAMASDVGVVVVFLIGFAVILKLVKNWRQWESVALLALYASLYFWNGWYGAWVIIPLWCCLAFSQTSRGPGSTSSMETPAIGGSQRLVH